jgi:hypothetical protein
MSPEEQAKKYAFKCHRKGDKAFPVNAIAFHPGFGKKKKLAVKMVLFLTIK